MSQSSAVDPGPSVLPATGVISLARGIPSPESFPVQQLMECAGRAIERHGRIALNYGEPQGFGPLCEWLAARHGVAADQILITPGSFIGLSFVARALLEGCGRAAVQVPAYDRMITLLGRLGAEVVTVAHTGEGLDLGAVRREFEQRSRPGFFYVMPTFHNPTGLTMTRRERDELVDLAIELDVVVVEDDPYGLLRMEGEPIPQVCELLRQRDAAHLAVFLSSFSKTVSPGMRVGYVVATTPLAARLRELATETYVSPPVLAQAQLFEFLDAGHLEPHLEELRSFLGQRRDALLEVLGDEMPASVSWTHPEGGYFLWLDLPQGIDAGSLAQRSAAAGVTIVPGSGFFAGPGGEHAARLSFSFPSVQEIRAGAARLAELVRG